MNTIEPGAIHIFKIWWLLVWRGGVLGALAGAAIGFILGIAFAIAGVPPDKAQTFFLIAGYLAGIAIVAWVVSMLLNKSFSDFRIVLIPLDDSTRETSL